MWQHIRCVIIPEKTMEGNPPVPDLFYCEICRLSQADPYVSFFFFWPNHSPTCICVCLCVCMCALRGCMIIANWWSSYVLVYWLVICWCLILWYRYGKMFILFNISLQVFYLQFIMCVAILTWQTFVVQFGWVKSNYWLGFFVVRIKLGCKTCKYRLAFVPPTT